MREDSVCYLANHLHWHNGSTCHGSPTLKQCQDYAISKGWVGKILEKTDTYRDGTNVRCYTLVTGDFEHWKQHGKFVSAIALSVVPLDGEE